MRSTLAALAALAIPAALASADVAAISGLSIKPGPAEKTPEGSLDQSAISLAGHAHFDVLGSTDNNLLHADYGRSDLRLTGLSWDLGATTFADVHLSELRIAVFNAAGEGVTFSPFAGLDSPGFGEVTSSFYDLEEMGLAFDLNGEDVYIELFFDQAYSASSEGVYAEESFITLELTPTPAPGTLGALATAGLLVARRRRR